MKSGWKDGWQAPLAALGMVVLFAAFKYKHIDTAADVAAWVQGVGSLLAIAVAIWIYARQVADKKANDAAETRAFVQAIRDEVQEAWDGYSVEMHPKLVAVKDGGAFYTTYPLTAEQFPIFTGNTAMVGRIDDAELRHAIVKTYALARGIRDTYLHNNQLLAEYEEVLKVGTLATNVNVQGRHARLVDYAVKLKERDKWVKDAVKDLLARADQWLAARSPRP